MISKTTASRFVGLVFLVAALSSGTANAAGTTPQGLRADGLRLTGLAERYQAMSGYTQQGLEADGLRWQGMAQAYANRADRPAASFYTPQALKAGGAALAGDGTLLRQAASRCREQLRLGRSRHRCDQCLRCAALRSRAGRRHSPHQAGEARRIELAGTHRRDMCQGQSLAHVVSGVVARGCRRRAHGGTSPCAKALWLATSRPSTRPMNGQMHHVLREGRVSPQAAARRRRRVAAPRRTRRRTARRSARARRTPPSGAHGRETPRRSSRNRRPAGRAVPEVPRPLLRRRRQLRHEDEATYP